jgi:hypothetical protein
MPAIASAQTIAAWINRDLSAGSVRLDQLNPAAVAAHFQCSPQVASEAIALCQQAAVAAAEALAVRTAAMRAATSAQGAAASAGGSHLQNNTPAALQARVAAPDQLLAQASAAFARGDLNSEAGALAQYWNSFSASQVLDAQLMPALGAENALPQGSPQRALLQAMRHAPQPQRLQMLRDFVMPKQQRAPSFGEDLVSKLQQGFQKIVANPGMAIGMMNPMLGMMMGGLQQQQPVAEPAPAPASLSLLDQLTHQASVANDKHRVLGRAYPSAGELMPLIQRFAAASEGLDVNMKTRLVAAFESALQRGDAQGLTALATRSEALAQADYEAKMRAALA